VSLPPTLEAAALFHVLGPLLFSGDFVEGIHIHGCAIAARRWARRRFELLEDAPPSKGPGAVRRGEAPLLAKDVKHDPLIEILPSSSVLPFAPVVWGRVAFQASREEVGGESLPEIVEDGWVL
jgi:hypothetical protein